MNTTPAPLLITSGEPAGIGPELCGLVSAQALHTQLNRTLVILGDAELLDQRSHAIGVSANWQRIDSLEELARFPQPGLYVWHHPLCVPCTTGRPTPANAPYVLGLLDSACDACLSGSAAAMVTAPIQKSAISPHWPGFMGHTEYLAARCGQNEVVMMLAGGGLKVALATTHLPLHAVPAAITVDGLRTTLEIVLTALQRHWGCTKPTVLVTGLNPHAGESGDLGREEIEVIRPVIDALVAQGHDVRGPYPADTLFQPKYLQEADAVLAMYHDQGLPVLKFASFGEGVNISLGLPIIRTSVDHGTALDLAGTRHINSGSMVEAITLAHTMSLKAQQVHS
ncbi:MAG TPA: 4-hydroxythreonine-4-phosphate dehydrogenase PdxA [Limnobacter sp.]|uniref:4-hydroxythreonine-4-phosphate dehydrogenase PdxA n=1 Tax=Limnobacter sp. TaxID=2003368 RepID=UPI002ED86EDC